MAIDAGNVDGKKARSGGIGEYLSPEAMNILLVVGMMFISGVVTWVDRAQGLVLFGTLFGALAARFEGGKRK